MTPTPEVQERIRRYLLGQLTDDARQELEQDLLTNEELFEELLVTEDEIIDEYLGGKLSTEERASFEKHFLATPERHEKLRFGRAFDRYLASQVSEAPVQLLTPSRTQWGWAQAFFSSPLRVAAVALVVAGLAFGIWRIFFHQSDVDKGLLALNAAYREQRPVESRISSLDYAPFSTTRGGPERVDSLARTRAEAILSNAVNERPNPASLHALGKVYLAKKHFDDAIKEFDEALKTDPKNAQLYSDLGAAWLEKGKIDLDTAKMDPSGPAGGKGFEELGHSLENLNKALELKPDLLEALFNRALSRQYQTLYSQAVDDWRAYLEKDSSSDWAVEARQNLKLLEEKKSGRSTEPKGKLDSFLTAYRARDDHAAWEVYSHSYTSAGNSVTKDLIDTFLRESATGHASDSLHAIDYLGRLQLRNTGDAYASDLAKVYSSAPPEIRARLSQAQDEVSKGYELFRQSKITDSMELFSSAREIFDEAGDYGEALFAEYTIAHGATLQPDLERSKRIFARIIPICEARGYKWLLAQCLIERAHLQADVNNYSEAIDDSNRALRLYEGLQDYNGTMRSFAQLASFHLFLNDSEKSLSFLQRGLAMAESEHLPPGQGWGMYIAAALNFSNLNLHRAALDYEKEALGLALDSNTPLYISRSYEYIGCTYGSLKSYEEAIQSLRRAYGQGQAIASERNGQNMMANAALKLGDLYRTSGDQARAIAAYDESDELYKGLGFDHYTYAAHKGKFLSYLAENNDAMASRELAVVIKLFEGYRERILEERQRNFFFDKEQDIYDLAINFAYSRTNDPTRAFEYSENSRARSLLDLLRHGGLVVESEGRFDLRMPPQVAESLPLEKIRELMPDGVQMLQYAVLKDKVIIWLITKSDFRTKIREVDSTRLADDVANSLKLISSGDEPGAATELKGLYDILIKPVEALLNQEKLLCIVPDKDLNYVPFGALISPKSGRYLVQDYRITLSPSSTVFIHCSNDAREKGGNKTERLLAVGNPSFDHQAYPQYSNLAAAEREADGVAMLYPSRRVLVKAQATVGVVKAELQRSDVAHFAAHYVIDPQSNLSSKMLLAKSADNDARPEQESGELESREVCRMKLSRTRLVVLSACQTGIERQYGGEGPASFARQFILAGVPVIVASLWPVDSDATAELMISFQRHRKTDGVPTAEALRRAQEEMIESNDPRYRRPYYWASFVAIGGYTEF